MFSPARRPLPARLDLEQQKTQAKELLRAFRSADPEAVERIRAVLPDKQRLTLADAQFVLAREYGFTSWAELRRRAAADAADSRTPSQRTHDAFRRRDAAEIRRLFVAYPELRARIDDPVAAFDSPAIVAYANDAAIVEVLLEFGADPNRRSAWWAGGFHALHSATGAAAERLLAAGAIPDTCAAAHLDDLDLLRHQLQADPARAHERGGDGQTPLHFAESRDAIDLLLAAGAELDARDVDHRSTPAEWMLASRRGLGRYELARYLTERGASVDIFLAAALGLTDRAHALIRQDPAVLDHRTGQGAYGEKKPSSYHIYFWSIGPGRSPLDTAEQFEHADTLAAMMGLASPVQRLLFACARGDEEEADRLLRNHPALMASLRPEQHRALADAAWTGNARAVSLMVTLGFDPRVAGHDGGSALHLAAWEGSPEMVEALLRDRRARDLLGVKDPHYGATPLGWCCHGSLHGSGGTGYPAVARALLAAGAQPGPDTTNASVEVLTVLAAHRS
jgi:ankyrin repeat protein